MEGKASSALLVQAHSDGSGRTAEQASQCLETKGVGKRHCGTNVRNTRAAMGKVLREFMYVLC